MWAVILAKKGHFLQEFLGIKYEIKNDKRIKWGYRITTFSNSSILFKFPIKAHGQEKEAKNFIEQNHNKILKNIQKLQIKHNERLNAKNAYINAYLQNNPNSLFIFERRYDVSELSIESITQILYDKAKSVLDRFALIMQLEYPPLVISTTKGYLGQCRRNMIKIDYRNVLNSEDLLSYLVVHELAHLRYMNHSKSFWQEVEKYYPRYKAAKRELITIASYNREILKHYDLLPRKLW